MLTLKFWSVCCLETRQIRQMPDLLERTKSMQGKINVYKLSVLFTCVS